MKKTNMEKIKEIAIAFLNAEIYSTSIPFVAHHPFTNTWQTMIMDQTKSKIIDLHKEDDCNLWRETIRQIIKDEQNLWHLFMLFNKVYILNFLKFTVQYISNDDLGMILSKFWRRIEQISIDDSVTAEEIISWFKKASKRKLMSESDLSVFNSLPQTVTIYRGVGMLNKEKKDALSWTLDYDTAKWFAHRFDKEGSEVWTMTIPKELILCYFSNPEQEVIVDTLAYKGQIKIEKV